MEYLGVIAVDHASQLVGELEGAPSGELHAWTEEIGGHEARVLVQLPIGVTPEHEEWPAVIARIRRAFDRLAADEEARRN